MKKVKAILLYGIIGVLALVAVTGLILDNLGKAEPYSVQANDEPQPEEDNGRPVVGIGLGDDYAKVTRTAVENAGGLQGIIHEGDTVLIKPNLCTDSTPDSPIMTDYRVVQEVVSMAKECGAKRVIIAEGPIMGIAFREGNLKRTGYINIPDVEFYEFNNCTKDDCYAIKAEDSLTNGTLYIPKVYMDADVVIGVPKLKTHGIAAGVTISLKNMIGVPPGKIYGIGGKNSLHSMGLNEVIVDLNKIRKPDFQVVDGIVGGQGNGPLTNTAVESKIILAGRDPVAVDTVALTFMGFTLEQAPHVKLAAESGLGVCDLTMIQIVGAELDAIKMAFRGPRS